MIEWEKGMEIIQLYKEVGSIRKVAELTGHARETVTAIVQGRHCPKGGKRRRKSQLDPYKTYIKERFASGLSAQLIFNELSKTDYEGSYHTVQRFIKSLKAALKSQQQLTVRFETPPGQQAQMDWGYCGYLDNGQGERKRLYVFVCVLSYSRMIYVQFTDSMKLDTLIACHQACFDYFGGIPEEILYDNMKQVRLAPNKLNPAFDDFANYCGFTIRCHRAYRARTKGKVERAVKYFKNNFLPVNTFDDVTEANAKAYHWMNETANSRQHGTTGDIPFERWPHEALQQVRDWQRFTLRTVVTRKSDKEGHVRYQGSRYSVDPAMAGRLVEVAHWGDTIQIVCPELMMTVEHRVAERAGLSIVNHEHLIAMVEQTTEQPVMPADVLRYAQVENRPLSVYQELVS